MRWLVAVPFLALGLLLTGTSRAEEKSESVKGIKGQFFRVEFTRTNAGEVQNITVPAGTWIKIEYTYPLSPPLPESADAKSSDDKVVKFGDIRHVRTNSKLLGVSRLGAFFHAEEKGKAVLTFDIKTGGQTGVILKVEAAVD